jgi:thiosulfate dehydrogenase [quinone] large subunit
MNTEKDTTLTKNQWYIFILLRIVIGWHFCYEGLVKIFDPSWSSSGYLKSSEWVFSGFLHWIPTHASLLKAVDLLNEWGLLLIGVGLILGLFTRLSCLCGMSLLAIYYLANPPLGGSQFEV